LKFIECRLRGAYVIDIEPIEDERGFFARSWCAREFREHGLSPELSQCNISFNHRRGALRGMHFQAHPHAEAKLVRCTRGAIYDVLVDLRPESKTFRQWEAYEISADNRRMVYIPEGFAHGFQTLENGCEVFYQMSAPYHAPSSCGVRWDDPSFAIEWPIRDPILSARDAAYPDFTVAAR
jgi:dTDP-4-dehydrorhamnose 3,5-epimerase